MASGPHPLEPLLLATAVGVVAFLLFGLSLMANVADFRAGGQLFRAEGETNRATLAAKGSVEPEAE